MKKFTAFLTAAVLCCLVLCAALATALAAAGDPYLAVNRSKLKTRQEYTFNWNEPTADKESINLWKRPADGDYKLVRSRLSANGSYTDSSATPGIWYYCLTADYNGKMHQSDEIMINVYCEDEDEACAYLRRKGMDNVWNLLFVVYERVDIGSFHRKFSPGQLSEIARYSRDIGRTMEGITEGRMKVGEVGLVQISEPITSASANPNGPYRALTYGPHGDVNFNYMLDHRDVTCVIVYAPLAGLPGTEGWLGLGGGTLNYRGEDYLTLIINDVDMSQHQYKFKGQNYSEEITVIVHEMLHGVETNSARNGWDFFQPLHNVEENGYRFEHGNIEWYHALTTNTLKNNRPGFREDSFYVSHHRISADKASGWHYDSDGVRRYYRYGLPTGE